MAVPNVDINYLAVLVAAVASFVIGMIWYSPALFGKAWMKAGGMTEKSMKAHKKNMGMKVFVSIVASLIMASVLAHFIKYLTATTFAEGMQTGFWLWLGFIATISLGSVLWENKSVKFYLINAGFRLVELLVMGGILAVWQ